MDEIGVPVDLYIYDLSKGAASLMSSMFLGRHVDGIWHTSVVAYGREYFFGSGGIESCNPGGTILGEPQRVEKLGDTFIPYQIFLDYISGLGETNFRGSEYNILKHNCNNFSDDLSNFLCGVGIPKYILELPEDLLNTPIGQTLKPLLESLSAGSNIVSVNGVRNTRQESPDYLQLNSQIEEARLQSLALEEKRNSINEKLARKERKKDKKRKKQQKEQDKLNNSSSENSDFSNSGFPNSSPPKTIMAEAAAAEMNGDSVVESFVEESSPGPARPRSEKLPSERVLEMEAEERQEEEEKRKHREPPIVFKDMDANAVFEKLTEAINPSSLPPPDQQSLEELQIYLVQGEGSWALGDNFLSFIGRLLSDTSLQSSARETVLNTLACAALRDDVILLLHQDRREHVLMNYAYSIDRIELNEQKALALFICNMFENLSSSEWLLYISEWSHNNQQISNIRVTTKVGVHSLLSDDQDMKDIGSAIIHNLACKEVKTVVFDDVAVELAMAVLQHLSTAPSEEHLYRCLKALFKFCQVSGQDVPQLIQMIGPNPVTFKGSSPRVDELIDAITRKLR